MDVCLGLVGFEFEFFGDVVLEEGECLLVWEDVFGGGCVEVCFVVSLVFVFLFLVVIDLGDLGEELLFGGDGCNGFLLSLYFVVVEVVVFCGFRVFIIRCSVSSCYVCQCFLVLDLRSVVMCLVLDVLNVDCLVLVWIGLWYGLE